MNEALILDLLERVKHRFYGKYRGSVVDVDAATMRIKAQVPSVLGEVQSGWCTACVPYAGPNVGFAMLPAIGSGVWIEFEGGDPSFPIWVGGYWRDGEFPSQATADTRVIVTQAGSLAFDDKAASVTVADASRDSLTLSSGAATITSNKGKIVADASGVSVNDGALEVT